MLWYKSWLETRWRFLVGIGLLTISACGTVLYYPELMKLMPMASSIDASGELGRRIKEGVELSRSYRGYIWSQWFSQNFSEMGTLFAILLGSGSPISQGSAGATMFTLSLPASRNRLLGVRMAAGLGEWFVIAIIPSEGACSVFSRWRYCSAFLRQVRPHRRRTLQREPSTAESWTRRTAQSPA